MKHIISFIIVFLWTLPIKADAFFQAEDGIRDSVASRGLGDVYKRQSQARIDYIARDAKQLLPSLQDYQNPWLGYRPTMPDCLPVLGRSPKFKNIFYAFGHNHLGWTLGPTTGKLITDLICQGSDINSVYSIDRYLS